MPRNFAVFILAAVFIILWRQPVNAADPLGCGHDFVSVTSTEPALGQQGGYSSHGGVCGCSYGTTQCCDGTPRQTSTCHAGGRFELAQAEDAADDAQAAADAAQDAADAAQKGVDAAEDASDKAAASGNPDAQNAADEAADQARDARDSAQDAADQAQSAADDLQ